MNESEFVVWLSRQRGVVRIEKMSKDLVDQIVAEEATVESILGTPVDNSGLRDCLDRNTIFVAFVEGNFWQPPTSTMLLKGDGGEIAGHDLHPLMIPDYQDRDDVMFINDEFILYADKDMGDAPVMEMVSQDYQGEDGSLPAEMSAVLWFPSPTSNDMIHNHFEQPIETLATAMIGLNL